MRGPVGEAGGRRGWRLGGDVGEEEKARDGVEGLVPLSELSDFRVSKSSDVLQVGQEVKVRVIDLKADQRRMTLSVRQADTTNAPQVTAKTTGPGSGFTIGDRLPDSLKHMLADSDDSKEG